MHQFSLKQKLQWGDGQKRSEQNNMNNYLTKKVSYFTYQQLLNELEELKKKYYVIGYTVKSQENTADVQLVEK